MMLYSRQEAVLTAVLLAAGLLPMDANAYVSFLKSGEELINTLHTHTYSPTLSLPSSKEIKVAKVCFITDISDCSGNEFANSEDLDNPNGGGMPDYDLNDAERCRNEGYTISGCSDGFEPSGKCPYGDYYAKCVETCPSGYKTCEPPYYGVGEMCGGKYASCEEDTERACKELNPDYTNTCESGWQINPNDKCKYDETFGTCCNQCIGYDYTTIPEGYVQDGEACTDCDGNKKYKIKPNPCDGFIDCGSVGPEIGAETCLSGTVTKYDNCKPCPNLGTLTSCPAHAICTFEECSNMWYVTGCESGYIWDEASKSCILPCDSSYKYTCIGEGYVGGNGEYCDGKYKSCNCQNGYIWKDGACVTCDSSYQYTCSGSHEKGVGESCNGKYQSCRCEDPYELINGVCGCSPSYKYTCDGDNERGSVESCNGKYESCYCRPDDSYDRGEYDWNDTTGKCDVTCEPDFKYTCTGPHEKPGGLHCGGKYMSCYCDENSNWNYSEGKCICTPKKCECRCNSATDCSNCPSSPSPVSLDKNERCSRLVTDGCGGTCKEWGWLREVYVRDCKNADGEIVLSYLVAEAIGNYAEKIYCDGVLTKTQGYLIADRMTLPLDTVTYPAEPVTCNKKFDFDDVYDNYNITFDYNKEFCGGKAKSVTVETVSGPQLDEFCSLKK